MPDKKPERLMPKPGPERHPNISDDIHEKASKLVRNLLASPSKSNAQIVAERQEGYRKEGAEE